MRAKGLRKLELLAPAADKHVAKEAILHGADAVYMGASSHGARKNAANSVEDIAEVAAFAHLFRAKVYVTVNTLVYDDEIGKVEKLIRSLYEAGVDALIVQDMGILRMNIPPIELHASTQCDIRTPEKAKFLEAAGFSQLVLARELSLEEINAITTAVSIPVECFVHGALCVSYSGRCRASFVSTGRSANRGECAQMCRLPYNLEDAAGRVLQRNRYLLSLRDFNASACLGDLVEAGASSFKIEGRLKDASYVKNITAYYRRRLDDIIESNPDKYCRASVGTSEISFVPDPVKSFNRGFTEYFLPGRDNRKMASMFTPKSMGEPINDLKDLNNGDGISFLNRNGDYEGIRVNRIEKGRIIGARPFILPDNARIYRTFDRKWQAELEKPTASRRIRIDMTVDNTGVSAVDERGLKVRVPLEYSPEPANKPMEPEKYLGKLGNSIYKLGEFINHLDKSVFIPASTLTSARRELTDLLDKANEATYRYGKRREEDKSYPFMSNIALPEENIANRLAEKFYRDHGVSEIERAMETGVWRPDDNVVMTTRYCLRRELGLCLKQNRGSKTNGVREPLYISSGKHRFRLAFDCRRCEMQVLRQ